MDYFVNTNWNKLTPYLVLFVFEIVLEFSECDTSAEVNKNLELGQKFLQNRQYSEALSYYHAAVEGDPKNFLTYFKRGTVYYALGKAKNAIQDFEKVLELNKKFTLAHLQLSDVHLKMGQLDDAQKHLRELLKVDSGNQKALDQHLMLTAHMESHNLIKRYYDMEQYSEVIELSRDVLEVSPWCLELREMIANSYLYLGDMMSAVNELRAANKLGPDMERHLRLANILYQIGHVKSALEETRACLKLDQDHKECKELYTKVKKVDKAFTECEAKHNEQQYSKAIESIKQVIKLEKKHPNVIFEARKWLCSLYNKVEKYTEALEECNKALEMRKDVDVFCDKADALLGLEMYDDAVLTYKQALEIDGRSERANEGVAKAQKRQKQSERKDYYKILGVKRTASKGEIMKAYRAAAREWHPDKFEQGSADQKRAEKKFRDIAAAKEVLTDEEKRKQFDNGEDPLDPESHNSQQFNPFQHFQHGSPFQFKFHFH